MTNVLIIGASGNIAKQATTMLIEEGLTVKALVRDAGKLSDIQHPNLSVFEKDLEDDFSTAFEQCEQVVFAAGSGGNTGAEKTLLIDLWAARNAVEYAKQHGTIRFTMVSSVGADDPDALPSAIRPYLVAKHMADEHLKLSGLRYTILRPGTLLDEPGTGKIQTIKPESKDDVVIPREDVATAIVKAVTSTGSENRIIPLYRGTRDIADFF